LSENTFPSNIRKLNRESSQTLFSQIEEIIRDGIENGVWLPNTPIPSERELGSIYGLSRMTVRRAIDQLVTDGSLYRANGKGTFVSEAKVKFKALSLAGLREQTIEMGYSPSARLLGVERILATKNNANILQVDEDEPLFFLERIVYGNNIPLGLLRSYIPVRRCKDLDKTDLANSSLYSILRNNYGIHIKRASETLETSLATPRESLLLNVSNGSPMFLLRIIMFDPNEQPIEYVKVIFRGDRIQLSLEL
jgi:GntR family transcriptional regulator